MSSLITQRQVRLEQEQGLGKFADWFKKNWKNCIKVACGFAIGGPIGGALALLGIFLSKPKGTQVNTGTTNEFGTIVLDFPLSAFELHRLNAYVDQQFIPFLRELVSSIDAEIIDFDVDGNGSLNSSHTGGNNVIVGINKCRKNQAILRAYLKDTTPRLVKEGNDEKRAVYTDGVLGFSPNMIMARNQLVIGIMDKLDEAINIYLTDNNIPQSITNPNFLASETREMYSMNFDWNSVVETTYEKLDEFIVVQDLSETPTDNTVTDEEINVPEVIAMAIEDIPTEVVEMVEIVDETNQAVPLITQVEITEEGVVQVPQSKKLPLVVKILGYSLAGLVVKKIISK